MTNQSDDNLAQLIREELSQHTVATLATVGEGGPHAASLMYAYDKELSLYWVSDPATRHSTELSNSASAAVTIAGQFDDFRAIRGLQMHGTAAPVDDPGQRKSALRLLGNRYAFLKLFQTGPSKLVERFAKIKVYRFRPETITLIDNAKGFGHKDVLNLGGKA